MIREKRQETRRETGRQLLIDPFREAFEHSRTGIALLDPDGTLCDVNPALCRMLGYPRERLLATPFTRVTHPEDWRTTLGYHRRLLETEGSFLEVKHRYLRADGSVMWGLLSLTLVRDPTGEPNFIVANLQDITELHDATQQLDETRACLEDRVRERTAELEEANDELRRFAHIVSHDLRAPLVNLQGFVDELEDAMALISTSTEPLVPQLPRLLRQELREALDGDIPEAIGFVRSATHRMSQLTSALLRFGRLGHAELFPEDIDMDELVHELVDTLHHQIEEHNCDVGIDALPNLIGDRTSLELIFANLLSNAVNYLRNDRPGRIEVWAEPPDEDTALTLQGPGIVFRVRDNGRGMSEKQAERAFEMFRRVGRSSVAGEGVGLTYVRAVVRRCGGRIWCDSRPGYGTTFSVALPLHGTD